MSVKKLISTINYIRDDSELDCPIAVTGWEQMGKSTLTIQVFRQMFYKGGPIEEFLEKYLAYTNNELEPKILNMKRLGGIIGDEAIRWAWRRNWMTSESKQMGMLWRQIGCKRLMAFFNLPDFWELDNIYRNRRVKLWIHVFAKGHAVVFQPNAHCYSTDPWFQKETIKNMTMLSQFSPWERQLKEYKKSRAFIKGGHITFSRLPREWFDVYSRISEQRKLEKENMVPDKIRIHRTMLVNMLIEEGRTETSISKELGVPQSSINYWKKQGEKYQIPTIND